MEVKSILVDALRFLAWQEYKTANKEALKDLEDGGYGLFAKAWNEEEEILKFDYEKLQDFVTGLDDNNAELSALRADYHAKKESAMNSL